MKETSCIRVFHEKLSQRIIPSILYSNLHLDLLDDEKV